MAETFRHGSGGHPPAADHTRCQRALAVHTRVQRERAHRDTEGAGAIGESLRTRDEQPWAQWLPLPENIYLICEIIPGSTRREDVLLDELKRNAEYLRQWIPEEGLEMTA